MEYWRCKDIALDALNSNIDGQVFMVLKAFTTKKLARKSVAVKLPQPKSPIVDASCLRILDLPNLDWKQMLWEHCQFILQIKLFIL